LTGVRAGRVFNREMLLFAEADAFGRTRKATSLPALSRAGSGSVAVVDPEHARTHHARKPGGVVFALAEGAEAARASPRA
jgi:hypothetical protein